MSAASPPGFVPISTAINSVKYMTLSAAYSGSLVIPLGLLILYCPSAVRRSPVFPTLVICLLLGIIWCFLSFAENTFTIKYPNEMPIRGIFLGSTSLNFLIPIFTDSVLIWKILWLFSSLSFPRWQRILLATPPAIITIPRLIVISIFLAQAGQDFDSTGGIIAASDYLTTSKLSLSEFIMQFVSNLYCSTVLLTQAYRLAHTSPDLVHRSGQLRKRFVYMFRVLASSFLVPVCIQLALIISTASTTNQWIREPIQWSNTYVSLHCAVLATVWSSIGRMSQKQEDVSSSFSRAPSRLQTQTHNRSYEDGNGKTHKFEPPSYDKKTDPDIEALADRDPTSEKATSQSLELTPHSSFSGWEKSPDLGLYNPSPVQGGGASSPPKPVRVKVDYSTVTYHDS